MRGTERHKITIAMHADNWAREANPAVNVKVQRFPDFGSNYGRGGVEAVRERFGCSEATAGRALEFAWEAQAREFWEWDDNDDASPLKEHLLPAFGGTLTITQEGRSGGWLVVEGLPDVEDWTRKQARAWKRFESEIEGQIEYLTAWAQIEELIYANEWAMDKDSLERMIAEALT